MALESEKRLAEIDENSGIKTPEEVVEAIDAVIDDFRNAVAAAQGELAEVCDGREILIWDTTFGVPSNALRANLETFGAQGYDSVSNLIVNRIFGGNMPTDASSFFKGTFGELAFKQVSVEHFVPWSSASVAAAVFAGSPASISRLDKHPVRIRDSKLTDEDVFRRTESIHDDLVDLGVPAVGICYGHQYMAHKHGGMIYQMSSERRRMETIAADPEGLDFLTRTLGIENTPQISRLFVSHHDAARFNPRKSRIFLSSVGEKPVTHGLLSIRNGEFSEDGEKNLALTLEELAGENGCDLSVQSHPETTLPHTLLILAKALITGHQVGNLKLEEKFNSIRDFLRIVANFLRSHRNFRG